MEFIFSSTDSLIMWNYSLDKIQRTEEMGGSVDKNPNGSTKLKALPNKKQINNIFPLLETELPDWSNCCLHWKSIDS